jgi:lipoyl(octanoyl) transferase
MEIECTVLKLGVVEYEAAWGLQQLLAKEIGAGKRPATLLLLEHPHTFTCGRSGEASNLLWDEIELARRGAIVHWVDRGGDVTYHGPGQLVGYPLLPLAPGGLKVRSDQRIHQADYVGYLRKLESTIIQTLEKLGVSGMRVKGKTGVWIQKKNVALEDGYAPGPEDIPTKIASIGVKVDVSGTSLHGFALNVNTDPSYWEGIIACGLVGYDTADLADLCQPAPEMGDVIEELVNAFGDEFGYRMSVDEAEARRILDLVLREGYDD